jgi:hypothetical protein
VLSQKGDCYDEHLSQNTRMIGLVRGNSPGVDRSGRIVCTIGAEDCRHTVGDVVARRYRRQSVGARETSSAETAAS